VEAEGLRAIRPTEGAESGSQGLCRRSRVGPSRKSRTTNNNTFLSHHFPSCQIDVHRATPSRHQPPDPFIRSTSELGHIASLLLLPVASSKPLLRQFSLPRSTAAVLIATHAQPDSPSRSQQPSPSLVAPTCFRETLRIRGCVTDTACLSTRLP
jgi:hypothetical protein